MSALWSARRRHTVLGTLLLWLYLQQRVRAQDPFDCHVSFDNGTNFDLTSLAGEHVISYTRDHPPSRTFEEVRFDLCNNLQKREGVADSDQCGTETRACLTMTNNKDGQGDRIVAVVPLAVSSKLSPEFTILSSPNKGLNLLLHGDTYPISPKKPQSFNLTLYCDTQLQEPSFISYDFSQMRVEWRAPAGCEIQGNDNDGNKEDGDGKGDEEVGSGVGWFFLLLFLAFVAYFALGAYYNYSTYGATGSDLIPHRDFWREVPYVLRDIASHLCSALRPSPRNGYIAV